MDRWPQFTDYISVIEQKSSDIFFEQFSRKSVIAHNIYISGLI